MKLVAIIQARMRSTRLPGKVLTTIGDNTMLSLVVKRTMAAKMVDETIVATTQNVHDDAIVRECEQLDVGIFRGDEDDVLDRYYRAASVVGAEAIVRITSDCPLIDPTLIDQTITTFLSGDFDYASNSLQRCYPRGLDTEVFTRNALGLAWANADKHYQRIHVTPYIYQNPKIFSIKSVAYDSDLSRFRWTVDTRKDLKLIQLIYKRFNWETNISWVDVVELMEREPYLAEINSQIRQKSLEEG